MGHFLWYFRQSMPVRIAQATERQTVTGGHSSMPRAGAGPRRTEAGGGIERRGSMGIAIGVSANRSNNGGESATAASDEVVGGDLAFWPV